MNKVASITIAVPWFRLTPLNLRSEYFSTDSNNIRPDKNQQMKSKYSQWNIAVLTVNMPKPRRFKVTSSSWTYKTNKDISLRFRLMLPSKRQFKFTKIQRCEHKIAKPTALVRGPRLLAVTCPCKKSSGVAILMSLQECVVFLHITVHRETNPKKPHRSK